MGINSRPQIKGVHFKNDKDQSSVPLFMMMHDMEKKQKKNLHDSYLLDVTKVIVILERLRDLFMPKTKCIKREDRKYCLRMQEKVIALLGIAWPVCARRQGTIPKFHNGEASTNIWNLHNMVLSAQDDQIAMYIYRSFKLRMREIKEAHGSWEAFYDKVMRYEGLEKDVPETLRTMPPEEIMRRSFKGYESVSSKSHYATISMDPLIRVVAKDMGFKVGKNEYIDTTGFNTHLLKKDVVIPEGNGTFIYGYKVHRKKFRREIKKNLVKYRFALPKGFLQFCFLNLKDSL